MKNNLVPVLLVKEEEFCLPFVLESLAQVDFDRYVIYDVGSKDKTRDIIEWWIEQHPTFDVIYRPLPMCPPVVQGTFRNAMIADADSEVYFLVDGDELYNKADLERVHAAANELEAAHDKNHRVKYGVVRRLEMDKSLQNAYDIKRTHHRLYTYDAFWKGTHPGEIAVYNQYPLTELDFPDILCYHFHNASRSSDDKDVPGRSHRRSQGTYHPGNLRQLRLLTEVPILRKPIAHWPVSPELKRVQHLWKESGYAYPNAPKHNLDVV